MSEQVKVKKGGFSGKKAADVEVAAKSSGVNAKEALEKIEEVLQANQGTCEVMSGANYGTFDNLVGQKVSAVRQSLAEAYNIAPDAIALVNGEQVNENHVLVNGATLEFIKSSGVKG